MPQHRQQIQTDQMRNALFLVGCLFASELTAEYAGCGQFRRKPVSGHRSAAGGWHFSKQVTGFTKRVCNIDHVAPRTSNGCCKHVRRANRTRCAHQLRPEKPSQVSAAQVKSKRSCAPPKNRLEQLMPYQLLDRGVSSKESMVMDAIKRSMIGLEQAKSGFTDFQCHEKPGNQVIGGHCGG